MRTSFPALRPLVATAAALLAALGAPACSGSGEPEGESERPTGVDARSVILITLDTTRPDALDCYGRYEGITPNLAEVAEESVMYDFAHTVAPITLPAHASMFTGLYPPRHTIRDNGFQSLPLSANTLAEAAREAGHQTGAFVGSTVLDGAFGLAQGFDVFDAPPRARLQQVTTNFPERSGEVVVGNARRWAQRRDRTRSFFLWVHMFDPHAPYLTHATPCPPTVNYHRPYYAEVVHVDEALGLLLGDLREDGTLDQATMLIVSDHGESLKEHREETHSHFCYESTLKVPFLIRYPEGYRKGERSSEVVSVVDVFPTLMEAMGLPFDPDVDGVSLYRRTVPDDRGVYFEAYSGYIAFGWSPISGWLDTKGKYIHSTTPEFYDAFAHPRELKNEIETTDLDPQEYRKAIASMVEKGALEIETDAAVDPSFLVDMRGLGYFSGGPLPNAMPHPLANTGLPSPKGMVDVFRDCQKGLSLADMQVYDQAITLFEQVLEKNPRNWLALERLGLCLYMLQRPAEALPHLQLAVEEGPQRAGTYYNLGLSLYTLGRGDEGVQAIERAIELDKSESVFLNGIITVLTELGRTEEAAEYKTRLRDVEAGR